MARQRIDLDINTQRLLGANRDRAAANRSAYVDREERKRTAAQATSPSTPAATTTGAPTQSEEPRGGTPDLYSPEEPAATRRKKKGVEVYGISNINRFAVYGSEEESYQSFTGYGSNYRYTIEYPAGVNNPVYILDYYNVEEKQFTNSYRLEATRWRPHFNQELQNSRRFFLGEAYTIENSITQLDWTFDQRSEPPYFALDLAVVASPPALPFLLEDKVSTTNNAFRGTYWENQGGSLTRSDGKYIYHSRLVIKCRPGPAILYSGFDPDTGLVGPSVYDGDNFEGFKTFSKDLTTYRYETTRRVVGPPSPTFRWSTQDNFGYGNPFDFYGLYWRFDLSTGATTFYSSFIGTLEDIDWVSDYELDQIVPAWFDGMHPGDPSRRLWKAYENNYSTMFSFLIEDFLYESTSFLQRWPPGLVYNEETGVLTIVTGLNGLDTPRIFSKQIEPPAGYANIPIFHLPTGYNEFLTTEQDFLNRGWTAEGPIPQNILDPLDQYFAIKQ